MALTRRRTSKLPSTEPISVVVPNRNHKDYLPGLLNAYMAQTRPADEIVVVDDASTDDSWSAIGELAQKNDRIRTVRLHERHGVNNAINRGIAEAKGTYVVVTAADDLVLPDFLHKSVDILSNHRDAGFCFSDPSFLTADGSRTWHHSLGLSETARYFAPDEIENMFRYAAFTFPTNAIVFRREALLESGGFNSELKWHADWFIAHVLACRHGACYVPENLTLFRVRSDSYSAQARRTWQGHPEVVAEILSLLRGDFCDVGQRLRRAAVLPEYDLRLIPLLLSRATHLEYVTARLIARIIVRHIWSLVGPSLPWVLRGKLRSAIMRLRNARQA